MIDIAKVVDIVLLLIDGHYGFEMETMEFLNALQTSGMPGNVFGILTHLDQFKKQDTLRTRKKQLKHRFWSELYQGAKLFYLSGVINGRYPDREVLNISRFLSVMKNPRPLVWRNSHPYCLADRFLDVTPPTDIEQNPKCDRQIALYGYLRGTNLPAHEAKVHVPGVGDVDVSEIEALADPCPTPHMDQQIAKATGKPKRKRLGEKQKLLFAPMSDVGGVLVDKDAVYIDIRNPTFDPEANSIANRGFGEQMMMGLQGDRTLLGQGDAGVRLFEDQSSLNDNSQQSHRKRRRLDLTSDAGNITDEAYVSGSGSELSGEGSDGEEGADIDSREAVDADADDNGDSESGSDVNFADSDSELGSAADASNDDVFASDLDDEDDGALRWKDDLGEKAQATHTKWKPRQIRDLVKMMYDISISPANVSRRWNDEMPAEQAIDSNSGDGEVDELFQHKRSNSEDYEDRFLPTYNFPQLEEKWRDEENLEAIASRFTSARISAQEGGDHAGEDVDSALADSEGDGEFEDLETDGNELNEANQSKSIEEEREKNARRKEELKQRFEQEDPEGLDNEKAQNKADAQQGDYGEDEWYDAQKAQLQKQLDVNRAELDALDERARLRVEGYKAGTYARLVLKDVPYEFAKNFSPRYPIILGGLTATENRFGFLQVRIKRHRWHHRTLKNNDPLIFSLGWRRFQSIPVYHLTDSRTRNRMLKYTPEHMHCFGTFYGPLVAPNTGFCAVQSFSNKNTGFRIAATGVILNVDESTEIVKKLKLKGFPHKVYKNTAIIRDMFASDLEIAKFKSGNLRTVSGVRGMVKGRAGAQYPEGYIRAGFEDKILKSDIVFLSAWTTVKPREFYMPMTNLLTEDTPDDRSSDNIWQGMRTTGQVRSEQNIPTPQNKDSFYRPIERVERHFNPLRVPRKLASDLPFKSQIAQMKPQQQDTYLQKRAVVTGGEEKKARDLMQKLYTLRNEKVAKRQAAQEKRKEPYRKKVAEDLEKKDAREKREREAYWRKEGRKRKHQEDGQGGGGKRRK